MLRKGGPMSFFPAQDPGAGDAPSCDAIDVVIVPRTADIGGFTVRRALPHARRRMVGPFIFFDHMGPAEFRSGQGIDVRPHPHIGLATATYLFDGEIFHRDSLGSEIAIRPGELNWMSAGRGIVHSERTAPDRRVAGERLHGLQCWVARAAQREEMAPGCDHYDQAGLPIVSGEGKTGRLSAGALFGARAAGGTPGPTLFAAAMLEPGTPLPLVPAYEERAVYLVSGDVDIQGDRFAPGQLLVFRPGGRITIAAATKAHIILLGGAAMDGPRYIWWNFVSSRKERIEQAKADWKAGRFAMVAGDSEFIPLPEA